MNDDVVGMATEELCPEGCDDFLIRKVGGGLECPSCGYTEGGDE